MNYMDVEDHPTDTPCHLVPWFIMKPARGAGSGDGPKEPPNSITQLLKGPSPDASVIICMCRDNKTPEVSDKLVYGSIHSTPARDTPYVHSRSCGALSPCRDQNSNEIDARPLQCVFSLTWAGGRRIKTHIKSLDATSSLHLGRWTKETPPPPFYFPLLLFLSSSSSVCYVGRYVSINGLIFCTSPVRDS